MPFELVIAIILILSGIFFLLVEIFLLPGISIAGIGAVIFLIGGVIYSYIYLGPTGGTVALILSLLLSVGAFVWVVKSKSIEKIALKTNIDQTVDNSHLKQIRTGDVGTTISRLNPIGNVIINHIIAKGKTFHYFRGRKTSNPCIRV